mmetsp:Transcript_35402/g.85672  ORF Transcript_35402/g.85672 Transcript_35402/m.85672 type:complete len:444 (-) Transcript_35402:708-2039(-)
MTSVNELSPNRVIIQTSIPNPEKLEVRSEAKVRFDGICFATTSISCAITSSDITTSKQHQQQHNQHQHRFNLLHQRSHNILHRVQRMSNNNDEDSSEEDSDIPPSLRALTDSTGELPTRLDSRTRSGRRPSDQIRAQARETLERANRVTASQSQPRRRSSSLPNNPPSPIIPRNMSAPAPAPPPVNEKKEIFEYVLKDILDLDPTDTLYRGVTESGLKSVTDLISITDIVINGIQYKTTSGSTNFLNMHDKGLLYAFRQWMAHRRAGGITVSDLAGWKTITNADFEQYRSGDYLLHNTSSNGTNATGNRGGNTKDPVADRLKSIKRDPSLFPELRERTAWDRFKASMITQARAQNVENVFKSKTAYTPVTTEDVAVFDLDQKYIMGVFDSKLKSTQGQAIVRKHYDDYDAQTVWAELCLAYDKGTAATFRATDLMKYLHRNST